MKIVSFLMFGGILIASSGAAWAVDASAYKSNWGAPTLSKSNKCFGASFGSGSGCEAGCGGWENRVAGWFAHEINENGAKFCATTVQSWRDNNSQKSWTSYFTASASPTCFWLCKEGYTGAGCAQSSTSAAAAKTCENTSTLTSAISLTKTKNADGKVAFFQTGKWDCNDKQNGQRSSDRNHEQDVILGIVGDAPSGRGAYVQPLVVRAFCGRSKNDDECKALIAPKGNKVLLCRIGYKVNSAKNDCVPIDEYACSGISDCSGWSGSRFAGATYKTVVVTTGDKSCLQYRCATEGYGFSDNPAKNISCIKCEDKDNMNATLQESNGQCIFTDKSKSATVSENGEGEIEERRKTTMSEMIEKRSTGDNKPCWQLETPTDYKKCLLGLPLVEEIQP